MNNRPAHLESAYKTELTPRQREVLGLVACGKTYGETAECLGITLDGVKWHMREVLTKLGVNSREEAVAWWKRDRSVSHRLARSMRALVPSLGLRTMIAGGAMAAVAGIAITGTMLSWWSFTGGSGGSNATNAVKGSSGPPACATTGGLTFSAAGTDVQNGELNQVSVTTAFINVPTTIPGCAMQDDVSLQLTQDGKPLAVEGNGAVFRFERTYLASALPGIDSVTFEWTNWCGDHNSPTFIDITASHYPTKDSRVAPPKCLDPSRPSRLVLLPPYQLVTSRSKSP